MAKDDDSTSKEDIEMPADKGAEKSGKDSEFMKDGEDTSPKRSKAPGHTHDPEHDKFLHKTMPDCSGS